MSADTYTGLIISEHVNKPKFAQVVALLGGALDDIVQVAKSIPAAYDIDNAIGAQLDVIGEWVGRPRVVEDILSIEFFGFQDDGAALQFGELINPSIGGRFYERFENFASSSTLADPEYRTILKAKIVRNQWDGTTSGLESALEYVFGVPCAIVDTGSLSLTIYVGRPITAIEKTLLSTFDLLPRPAGVAIQAIQYRSFLAGDAKSTTSATAHL
jgi:hypothetical protein